VNKYYADYDNWKSDSDDKGGMIPSFWGSENGSTSSCHSQHNIYSHMPPTETRSTNIFREKPPIAVLRPRNRVQKMVLLIRMIMLQTINKAPMDDILRIPGLLPRARSTNIFREKPPIAVLRPRNRRMPAELPMNNSAIKLLLY